VVLRGSFGSWRRRKEDVQKEGQVAHFSFWREEKDNRYMRASAKSVIVDYQLLIAFLLFLILTMRAY